MRDTGMVAFARYTFYKHINPCAIRQEIMINFLNYLLALENRKITKDPCVGNIDVISKVLVLSGARPYVTPLTLGAHLQDYIDSQATV